MSQTRVDAAQRALVERVRAALPAGSAVREVAMFGGRAVLLDGSVLVSAGRGGALLVRIDPTERDALLARHGAGPASMGGGRPMGAGWLTVEPAAFGTDAELASWLEVALRRHRGATTR
jgi:hypothetical protein